MPTKTTNDGYGELACAYYDFLRPDASPYEISTYSSLFPQTVDGPILEAACGSGRLLIPMVKNGIEVHGVDNSSAMLKRAFANLDAKSLKTQLFEQSLTDLQLERRYAAIFIAGCSFPHFCDNQTALRVLKRLREHLLPGGRLIINTDVPWDMIGESINNGRLLRQVCTIKRDIEFRYLEDSMVSASITVDFHIPEQLAIAQYRYRQIRDDEVLKQEDEQLSWRWYYQAEMQLLLELAGFQLSEVSDHSFRSDHWTTIYTASDAA